MNNEQEKAQVAPDDLDSYLDGKYSLLLAAQFKLSYKNVLDDFSVPPHAKSTQPLELPEAPDDGVLDDDFADQLAKGMEALMADMEDKPADFDRQMEQLREHFHAQNLDGGASTSTSKGILPMPPFATASSSSAAASAAGAGSLQDKIAETMNKLKNSSNAVGSEVQAGLDTDMMQQMMKQMEGLMDSGDLNTMLEGMMESLLSKDVLYEPMKDLAAKYPAWLAENKSNLSEEDYARYTKQLSFVEQILAVYDDPTPSPENSKRVVDLMQGMQECGNPPAEILKELAPGLELGPDGVPKLPDINDKECILM
ncbi:hypothetical protein SmJEL517_g05722 [Synchytrium microbalum]|uniref:Pex19 protein n=1 Tax=Synchytrium microbalum TaxID=1806994 RepID=A0A507BME1_9FUNG|nr:uncharacterized protein SmJEL517_g05722 [Synchytrium microbalum]TPX30797.1 hypothetical protein SmJEL517_g05722 [Synchytrium microbalum]